MFAEGNSYFCLEHNTSAYIYQVLAQDPHLYHRQQYLDGNLLHWFAEP